jgi:hypothetical protein
VLFKVARPILLNGIAEFISRADLADRAIFVTLAPIAKEQRRSKEILFSFGLLSCGFKATADDGVEVVGDALIRGSS